jgi:hypothetical protein
LSFANEVRRESFWGPWSVKFKHKTAIFRQINKKRTAVHHDALEFPDGQIVLLTSLKRGQQATVLQLPASAIRSNAEQPVEAIAVEAF